MQVDTTRRSRRKSDAPSIVCLRLGLQMIKGSKWKWNANNLRLNESVWNNNSAQKRKPSGKKNYAMCKAKRYPSLKQNERNEKWIGKRRCKDEKRKKEKNDNKKKKKRKIKSCAVRKRWKW